MYDVASSLHQFFTVLSEAIMWFWTFVSLGLAGILDLAAGALLVHLLSGYFSHPLEWWQYAVGAFLGASPDIDLLSWFLGKNVYEHHEYLTHRPIVGIPLAVVFGWFLGGTFWATAAGIGALWHYLHDTEGFLCLSNGGIAWFWPFSKKYWGIRNWRLVSRTPEEHEKTENESRYFHVTYLDPTRQSVIEFALASIFIGYVVGDLFAFRFGLVATYLFWVSIVVLWIIYHSGETRV